MPFCRKPHPTPRSTSSSGAISPVYAPTPFTQLFCAAIW